MLPWRSVHLLPFVAAALALILSGWIAPGAPAPAPAPGLGGSPTSSQGGQATAALGDRRPRRPTERLSAAQRGALAWWAELGGDGWSDSEVEAALAAAEPQAGAALTPTTAARREKLALERLRRRARGTRDLAWAAAEVYRLEQARIIAPFHWVDDAGDWNRATLRSVDDLLYCRYNNCFCFVNFCAWLAGDQPVGAHGVPRISHLAWMSPTAAGAAPMDGPPARGLVLVNAHRWRVNNNEYGFQHTGIAVDGGEVVHLGSRDLRRDPADRVFARLTETVFVGPFDWEGFSASVR